MSPPGHSLLYRVELATTMAHCPRPDLIGTLVYRDFTMPNGSVKWFIGTVDKWLPNKRRFRVIYEDEDRRRMSIRNVELYTFRVADCINMLERSDNKSQTFAKIMRLLSKDQDWMIDELPSIFENLGIDVDPDDITEIGPYLWRMLGRSASEKFYNAKRMLEMFYYM